MSVPDTIYALSTPWGVSGVAVVRVSGQAAFAGLHVLSGHQDFTARQARLPTLKYPENGQTIDHALVLPFRAPRSFTGEDVIEYQIHGGVAVINEMLRTLSSLPGYRMAEPGGFTRRAFENGKMDLTAAQGVADQCTNVEILALLITSYGHAERRR